MKCYKYNQEQQVDCGEGEQVFQALFLKIIGEELEGNKACH